MATARNFDQDVCVARDRVQSIATLVVDQSRDQLDKTSAQIAETFERLPGAEEFMADQLVRAEGQVEQSATTIDQHLSAALDRVRDQVREALPQMTSQVEQTCAGLQEQIKKTAQKAHQSLREQLEVVHVDRMREEINAVVTPLRRQVLGNLEDPAECGRDLRRQLTSDQADPAPREAAMDRPLVEGQTRTPSIGPKGKAKGPGRLPAGAGSDDEPANDVK